METLIYCLLAAIGIGIGAFVLFVTIMIALLALRIFIVIIPYAIAIALCVALCSCGGDVGGLEIVNDSAQSSALALAAIDATDAELTVSGLGALDVSGWRVTLTAAPGDRCPLNANACMNAETRGISSPFPVESDFWPTSRMAGTLCHELVHQHLFRTTGDSDSVHTHAELFSQESGLCGRVGRQF